VDSQYDVCIIGAGPGGYVAAIRAAQLGLKPVVVERQWAGGVCLNQGCIPTKAMLRSADVFRTLRQGEQYGVLADNVRLDYGAVVARRERIVLGLRKGVEVLLKANGAEYLQGSATVRGAGEVEVQVQDGARTIRARNLVIATGSRPARLPIAGADGSGVINSDQALELQQPPKSLVVIGGGAVGCEWASIFRAFGGEVTLVEMLPTLLPLEDEDMGRALARVFAKDGITVHTGATVQQIEDGPNGGKRSTVAWPDGKTVQVDSELVLIGVGRTPNTDGLNLEAAGVQPNRRGFVDVDDHLRTGVGTVYAIGDVTGRALLAHVAHHQGLVAVENVAGEEHTIDYKAVPAVTFTHPEVASVGLSEAKAREAGYDVQVGRFPVAALGRAQTYGETDGIVKVVADSKYGQVLGVHIIGPSAGEIIQEGVLAINLEATLDDLANSIHAHPTLPEGIMEAALVALGRPIHVARSRRPA
jgi:dihydrolipoamide dehydrogenase